MSGAGEEPAPFGYNGIIQQGGLRRSSMQSHPRISIDPQVMGGKPCITGTRITVELILEKLAVGLTYDQLLEEHPRLQREDIFAAIGFAHDYLAHQDIILADGQAL
jgi:uncharacterized protein (DUF433 family)